MRTRSKLARPGLSFRYGLDVPAELAYLQIGIDDHSRRCVVVEQEPLDLSGEIERCRGGGRRHGTTAADRVSRGLGRWGDERESLSSRVDLGLLVHEREEIGEAAHRLCFPQQEKAAGTKREVKRRKHPALQKRAQVDEDVPETDEVELGERAGPG